MQREHGESCGNYLKGGALGRNEKICSDGKHPELLIKQIIDMAQQIDALQSRADNQRVAIIAKNQHINNLNRVMEVKEQRVVNLVRELILIKKYYGFDRIFRKISIKLRAQNKGIHKK